jgi:hypothetical protein
LSRRASIIGLVAMLAACQPNPNGQGVAEFGSVSGTVVDANNPTQPIQQFTVSIGGQSVSVSPAAKGAYSVSNIPIGTQNLTIFAIGYQTFNQPGIIVQAGQTTQVPSIGLVSTTGL